MSVPIFRPGQQPVYQIAEGAVRRWASMKARGTLSDLVGPSSERPSARCEILRPR